MPASSSAAAIVLRRMMFMSVSRSVGCGGWGGAAAGGDTQAGQAGTEHQPRGRLGHGVQRRDRELAVARYRGAEEARPRRILPGNDEGVVPRVQRPAEG